MGVANLIADGISMGLGDYLSEKAENEYHNLEYKREKWEMENNPVGEVHEMIELYEQQGITTEDATNILETMAKYPTFFVDHMMQVELNIPPPDPEASPAKKGMVTAGSFFVFGFVPLLAYVALGDVLTPDGLFWVSICLTASATFLLGWVKGTLAHQNRFIAGASMTANGALAAGASFVVGWALEGSAR